MKAWPKILVVLLAGGVLASQGASASATVDVAIQQAPDPSAAVAAYANGFAIDRNDPKLYGAFVSRMVDLGLPEMAYHQAQTLNTLQANNGLAWGVVAYVDARRAKMPEAISAITLAGQFAPEDKFVQHTAGELVAWYDLKADKTTIPDNTKAGLTKIRELLEKRPAFTEAYSAAQRAYQTHAAAASGPTQVAATQTAPVQTAPNQATPAPMVPDAPQVPMAPQAQADQIAPLGYAATGPASYPDYSSSDYYPDYSGAYLDWEPNYPYGWGPSRVAPGPWWWQPCGYWGGCDFFPFVGTSFVFGDFDHFHHHDGNFGHDGRFGHNGGFGHGHDPAFWQNGSQGRNSFFGTPARPNPSTAQWAHADSAASWPSARTVAAGHWWSSAGQRNTLATAAAAGSSARLGGLASTRGNWGWTGSSSVYRTAPVLRGTGAGQGYYSRSYTVPRGSWAAPSYRGPAYATPRYAVPSRGSFGSYGSWRGGSAIVSTAPRSIGGDWGGFHGATSSSGGFHGGGFSSGGFHGGGFGGGGFHAGGFGGGGHR
jgi:hypothetical protein